MSIERRWAADEFRPERLTGEIAAAGSVRDLELLAAEVRAALAGHSDLSHFEATISARQRLLARAHALLEEIARVEVGEEDRW